MADTPETPDTPAADDAKPTPRRRAAPRKTAASATSTPRVTKPRGAPRKSVVAKAEDGVAKAATAVKDAATGAADKAVKAVKPRSSSRTSARTGGRTAAAATGTRSAAAKRAAGTGTKRPSAKRGGGRKADATSALDRATERVGGKWGAAGIVGGIAAAAALLTLRGSSGKPTAGKPQSDTGIKGGAHQPDGTDSSASFQAGIADENTIPDKV